jgi:hypothetical protein
MTLRVSSLESIPMSVHIPGWFKGNLLLRVACGVVGSAQDVDESLVFDRSRASTSFQGNDNQWFLKLYTVVRQWRMREADCAGGQNCLRKAEKAGVLEGTEAVIGSILSWNDLEESKSYREDGEGIWHAKSTLFIDQVSSEARIVCLIDIFAMHKRV